METIHGLARDVNLSRWGTRRPRRHHLPCGEFRLIVTRQTQNWLAFPTRFGRALIFRDSIVNLSVAMPVYHLVLHTYRSWNADNPRGYVRRKIHGALAPDPSLARHRADIAAHPPYTLDATARELCLHAAHAACAYKKWRLHAVAVDPTHVHLIVSWIGTAKPCTVVAILKRHISLALRYQHDGASRKRFSRGESKQRITSADHLRVLIQSYMPSHHKNFWREGTPPP